MLVFKKTRIERKKSFAQLVGEQLSLREGRTYGTGCFFNALFLMPV